MQNNYCILIHYHEISLKGNNRSWFERCLIKNIKNQLKGLVCTRVHLTAARIFCFGIDASVWNEYAMRLNRVMGIKHATLMTQLEPDLENIKSVVTSQLEGLEFESFRITSRRQYKEYYLSSQQLDIISL